MKNKLQSFFESYRANAHWDIERMARHKVILPELLSLVNGDILEIGAHVGTSTKMLCEIAEKFNRTVYVIDPWDGRQEGDGDVYQQFLGNTVNIKNLVVLRHGSERPEAFDSVKSKNFAFIFIDGMHSYDAVVGDFTRYRTLLNKNGVICVDDWTGPYTFCEQIRRAIYDHINDEFVMIDSPSTLIEKYIVRI